LAIDASVASAGIETGLVFRYVSKTGHVWGDGISEKAVWWVVREYAKLAGIDVLPPHDLRRTCARLCYLAGGGLNRFNSYSATDP
jgi:integrase